MRTPAVCFIDPSIIAHQCAIPILVSIEAYQIVPLIRLLWSDPVLDTYWIQMERTRAASKRADEMRRNQSAMVWSDAQKTIATYPLTQHVVEAVALSGADFLLTESGHLYSGVEATVSTADEFLTQLLRGPHRMAVKAAINNNPPVRLAVKWATFMPYSWHEYQSPP